MIFPDFYWRWDLNCLQNKTAQKATNEEEPLGKAYMKYLDALSNAADNHLYNLHVGRMLLLQNKPEDAVTRLQVAVGLKPTSVDARSVWNVFAEFWTADWCFPWVLNSLRYIKHFNFQKFCWGLHKILWMLHCVFAWD